MIVIKKLVSLKMVAMETRKSYFLTSKRLNRKIFHQKQTKNYSWLDKCKKKNVR